MIRASASTDPLAALERRLAAVESRLAALESRRRPEPADDAALLSALALVFGSRVLTVNAVLASVHPEVQDAVGGLTPRQLGAAFKRIHRRSTEPYRLERIGRDGGGTLWALRHVSDARHTDA